MTAEHRTRVLILGGLALVLAASSMAWFLANFEQRTQEVDAGYSDAARGNPYLAAERFLERLGIPVQSVSGRGPLRDLPPPEDTLVVKALGVLNQERRETLHQWLEQGGRLIVQAGGSSNPTVDARTDDFLAGYGVSRLELDSEPAGARGGRSRVISIAMEGYPHPVEVSFRTGYYLEDRDGKAKGAVRDGEGRPLLLQYRVGAGLLTVTSDGSFITNPRIGEQDHALFLTLLASPDDEGKVWLLYDIAMPSLIVLLWQRAPYAVISVLCLIGATLWHLGGRLGPLLPLPGSDRRDLLVHLQASAGFLWRHGRGSRLIAVTRERVEGTWLRRHPVLRELDTARRAAWIAQRTGLPTREVERALYPPAGDAEDLVARTALLQRLWSDLSAPVHEARKADGPAGAGPVSSARSLPEPGRLL